MNFLEIKKSVKILIISAAALTFMVGCRGKTAKNDANQNAQSQIEIQPDDDLEKSKNGQKPFDINYDNFVSNEKFLNKIKFYREIYFAYKNASKEFEQNKIALTDELRENLNSEYEQKKAAEVKNIEERLQKEYTENLEQEKAKITDELRKEFEAEFEEKKNAEVKTAEERLQKEYAENLEQEKTKIQESSEKEFESKKEDYKSEVRKELTSEYEHKKQVEISALKVQLKNEANIENQSYTQRFKVAAFYSFCAVILLILIHTIFHVIHTKRKEDAEKLKREKEDNERKEKEKQRSEEQKKKEEEEKLRREREEQEEKDKENQERKNQEMKIQKENESYKNLKIAEYYEFLKSAEGDESSLIDYWTEHQTDGNYQLKWEAYQEAKSRYNENF